MQGVALGTETILALLPFVILLGVFFLYLLTRGWRRDSLAALTRLRSGLREAQTIYQHLRRGAGVFSMEDPEPFGAVVDALIQCLGQIETELSWLFQQYGDMHQLFRTLSQPGWKMMLTLPLQWRDLSNQTKGVEGALADVQVALKDAEQLSDRLQKLGWEIAKQSRNILTDAQMAGTIFESLTRESQIVDARLHESWQEACGWEETILAQIPVVFLSDDEQSVLQQADKETTAHIYRVIKSAAPAVRALLEQARYWQGQYAYLVETFSSLSNAFDLAIDKYQRLENLPVHPIRWEKTLAMRQRLIQQFAVLTPLQKQRTLDELQSACTTLEGLSNRLPEFVAGVDRAEEDYQQLVPLLAVIATEQSQVWLRNAQRVAVTVEKYHVENWPRTDRIETFTRDLDELDAVRNRLLPKLPTIPLGENELSVIVEQLGDLDLKQRQLQERTQTIENRLHEIAAMERDARDPLERCRLLLGQASSIVGANPFLKNTIGQEIQKYLVNVEQSLDDLKQTNTSTVEQKAKKINALLKKIELSMLKWADSLEEDVGFRKEQLAEKILVLEEKMHLDEPALKESMRLLKQVQKDVTDSPAKKEIGDTLLGLVGRLKTANDAWQNCVINHQKVDEFAGAVLEMYSKADKHRQAALERFEKAENLAPEDLKWPPTTQRLTTERKQLLGLEAQWSSIQHAPQKAIQMVATLSNLSEGYHGIEMQLGNIVTAAQQERERILEFERRLGESQKMWRRLMQQNSSNRVVQEGIDDLLSEIDNDFHALQQRYELGNILYGQALQGMRQICRKIDDTTIHVDNSQEMDINGILLRRS